MLDIAEINNGFEVKFQYKPWLVDAIKKIPGASFRNKGGEKFWHVPARSESELFTLARSINHNSGRVAPEVRHVEIGEIEPLPELTTSIDLKMQLFSYQRNGVQYGINKKKFINGDDMGLGKTAQSIATLVGGGAKCILIICPATLKENWKREWKMWTGRDAVILTDRTKNTWPQYYNVGLSNVFIVNYESLKKYFVKAINKPANKPLRLNHIVFHDTINLFDAVVLDEIHRAKDLRTQLTKFCKGIATGKEWIMGLTGTPVVNKPKDLVSQLGIIEILSSFGGYTKFVDRFCQGYSQASNLRELNYLLHKNGFFRRLKKDVLQDLPDKMRNIFRVEITNRQEYVKAENNLVSYLRDNLQKTEGEITKALRGEAMVLIGILKKISARGKIAAVVEMINEVIDGGEKIIVFAWHKEVVRSIQEAVPGSLTIVGDNSLKERQYAVDTFQNNPDSKVIICNIQSGGVGITLTASSRVAFIELPWHPAHADQAEDRAWRIGQKNSVDCRYLLGMNTIDDYIYKIIDKKRAIVSQVTGAENEIETSVIDEFINLFSKERC